MVPSGTCHSTLKCFVSCQYVHEPGRRRETGERESMILKTLEPETLSSQRKENAPTSNLRKYFVDKWLSCQHGPRSVTCVTLHQQSCLPRRAAHYEPTNIQRGAVLSQPVCDKASERCRWEQVGELGRGGGGESGGGHCPRRCGIVRGREDEIKDAMTRRATVCEAKACESQQNAKEGKRKDVNAQPRLRLFPVSYVFMMIL